MEYWLFRKRFTTQWAVISFACYIFGIQHCEPTRLRIHLETGDVYIKDMIPSVGYNQSDSVPFRLTPNIQEFMTPVGVEGVFLSALVSTAKCLLRPENELADYLSLFVRDEFLIWKRMGYSGTNGQRIKDKTSDLLENDSESRLKPYDASMFGAILANDVEKIVDELIIKTRYVAGQHERDLVKQIRV